MNAFYRIAIWIHLHYIVLLPRLSKQTGAFTTSSSNNRCTCEWTNCRHSPTRGNFARPFTAADSQPTREPPLPRADSTLRRPFLSLPYLPLRVFYSAVHHLLNTSSTGCYLLSTFPLELFGQFIARSTNFRQFMTSFGPLPSCLSRLQHLSL